MWEDLLSVHWFDGLVVKRQHLEHLDDRILQIGSQSSLAMGLHPCVFGVLGQTGPIVEARFLQGIADEGEESRLQFDILRSFKGINASGQMTLAISKFDSDDSTPSFYTPVPEVSDKPQKFLLCVTPNTKDHNNENFPMMEEKLVVQKPRLVGELVHPSDYSSHKVQGVPIAKIEVLENKCEIIQDFIPPLATISDLKSFDVNLQKDIQVKLNGLVTTLKNLQVEVALSEAKGELLLRMIHFQNLNNLLLSKAGYIQQFLEIRFVDFYLQIAMPLAEWAQLFAQRIKGNQMLHEQVKKLAESVHSIELSTLGANGREVLKLISKLIEKTARSLQ